MTATAVHGTGRSTRQRVAVTELPPGRRPAGRRNAPPTCRQRGRRPAAVAPPSRVSVIVADPRIATWSTPPERLRLTRRGRLMVTLLTLAVLVGAFSVGRGSASRAVAAAPVSARAVVSVAVGDTLWSIAREVRPQADPRSVVEELVKLNHLDSRPLEAGQRLLVPARQ